MSEDVNTYGLISRGEIAELCGVTPARISQLSAEWSFPSPAYRHKGITLWERRQIIPWAIQAGYIKEY